MKMSEPLMISGGSGRISCLIIFHCSSPQQQSFFFFLFTRHTDPSSPWIRIDSCEVHNFHSFRLKLLLRSLVFLYESNTEHRNHVVPAHNLAQVFGTELYLSHFISLSNNNRKFPEFTPVIRWFSWNLVVLVKSCWKRLSVLPTSGWRFKWKTKARRWATFLLRNISVLSWQHITCVMLHYVISCYK